MDHYYIIKLLNRFEAFFFIKIQVLSASTRQTSTRQEPERKTKYVQCTK